MPEEKPKFTERLLKRFGYMPVRDVSQTHEDLAETLRWEVTPPKTLDYLGTYEKSLWVYASVYRIATSVGKVPFKIYKKRVTKQGEREELFDKPVNRVLQRPNPYMTRFDLWEATVAYLELAGNTYWELVAEADKPPEEIYVLRPDRMTVKPEAKKLVSSYVFNVNGRKIIFQPEDILHFKYFSPTSDLYGTSSIAPAEKSIILDLYALAFNARFFKSGARLMGVLETDRTLSQKSYQRLERKWRERYGGSEKAFKTAILEEGLKYREIASKHTDMEFIEQRKMTREEILGASGVHPANVGLFEYCIAKNEKVLLASGEEVPIQNLKIGQEALSFNIEKKRFEPHKIKNVFSRGKRPVYELKTGNRTIKATDNHPFLTLLPGINPAYPRKIAWKKLKDLKKGDLIAILTEAPDWMGQGNNHLPDGTVATKDLMEQLGLYVGDGSPSFQYFSSQAQRAQGLRGAMISFALPLDHPKQEYYMNQAKQVWEYSRKFKRKTEMRICQQKSSFAVCSAKAVKQIYDWGFKGTARTKRIPAWVFRLEKNLKTAFLRGYFNSDGGHLKFQRKDDSIKTRITVVASNEVLVEQIRGLCIQVGYSVCNISESHRMTNYGMNDLWRFLICNFDGENFVKYNSSGFHGKIGCKTGGKRNPLKVLGDGMNWVSIRDIKEVEEAETYDLEIEGIHNFFAAGIVVANSNYSNSLEQKKLFWEDTMVPKLIKLQETISTFFLPRFGPHLVGEFDLSVIQALQESEEIKAKTASLNVDSGIMTRNEARKRFYNLPPTEGGDKITIRGKYITVVEGAEEAEPVELTREDLRDIRTHLRKLRKERKD